MTSIQSASIFLFVWSFYALLLTLKHGVHAIPRARSIDHTPSVIPVAIHVSQCLSNSTHCNCVLRGATDKPRECLTLVQNSVVEGLSTSSEGAAKCLNMTCDEDQRRQYDYRCECGSTDICEKRTVHEFERISEGNDLLVSCRQVQREMPFTVVDQRTAFQISSADDFNMFLNGIQIGQGQGDTEHISTQTIRNIKVVPGDVVAIMVKKGDRDSHMGYGIKLKFNDINNEMRSFDRNWKCSNRFHALWLDPHFDATPPDWLAPILSKEMKHYNEKHGDSPSDENIPWMWIANHQRNMDVVYCRYKF